MEKLRENQEQQDTRHAAITTVLHNITYRLAEIRFVPPIPPAPLPTSPLHASSSQVTHTPQNPSIPPPNHTHQPHPLYTPPPQPYPQSPTQTTCKETPLHDFILHARRRFRDLETGFGPFSYINYQAELFKLKQLGTVADYQKQFETLCNRIWGLSQEVILNCFLSSLLCNIPKFTIPNIVDIRKSGSYWRGRGVATRRISPEREGARSSERVVLPLDKSRLSEKLSPKREHQFLNDAKGCGSSPKRAYPRLSEKKRNGLRSSAPLESKRRPEKSEGFK
ncbi:hypothetical protein Lal_00032104 [Lupinus albus]|nr:hypothetical protein Lal_00032104 [Lupinus albus]